MAGNEQDAKEHDRRQIAFVWPFWQKPAKYDELRWSVRSVYQNFREPYCEIQTVIVGDQPVIRRHKESWYGGRIIRVPRTVGGGGSAGIEDQCRKWMMALEDESLPDTLVWMMDDVYLIKPVTLGDLRTPRSMGLWTRERLENWEPKTWWLQAKKRTLLELSNRGLPLFDFASHLPHVVDRQRALTLLKEYGLPESRLLWEVIYENANLAESPQPATPFLRIIPNAKCLKGMYGATESASVMVSAGDSWNEAHRTYLYETFKEPAPVEVIPPIPPKLIRPEPQPTPAAPVIHKSRPKVTCVMNAWGRPSAFPCQFNAIKGQSVENEVMVWQNAHAETKRDWKRDWFDEAQVTHASCNRNLGVWARFAYALNARTEFVCIFDDDIVPGKDWLANCLDTFQRYPGLLGGNGVIFHSLTNYNSRNNYGWAFPNHYVTQVDIVGHVWFLRREWLGLYWAEMPDLSQPVIAGEDFHASYALQKHGINTFVPQHRKKTPSRWSCRNPKQGKQFGRMSVALSKHADHSAKIREGLSLYVSKGFRLLEHDQLTKKPGA